MPLSPIDSVLQKWQQRASIMRTNGIPDGHWHDLFKQDLQNVMGGGTAMSANEVGTALVSQLRGSPVIKDPKPHTGLGSIFGNAVHDLWGIVTGFPGAVVRSTYHAPSELHNFASFFPHELHGDQPWLSAHGFEANPGGSLWRQLGAGVRNAATAMGRDIPAPLAFGGLFAPGLNTAAELTTTKGRTALQTHPVGTLLDLLPAAGEAGHLAAGGRVADMVAAGEQPSAALSKLAEGKPLSALGKTLSSHGPTALVDDTIASWAQGVGLHPELSERLARPYSIIKRKAEAEVRQLFDEHLKPIFGQLTPEERAQMYEDATKGFADPSSPHYSPEYEAKFNAVVQSVNRLNDWYEQEAGTSMIRVPTPNGGSELFPVDSTVGDSYRKYEHAETMHQRSEDLLNKATFYVDEMKQRLEQRQGKVRRWKEPIGDFNARPNGAVGVDVIRHSLTPLVEDFRDADPRQMYKEVFQKITDGTLAKRTVQSLMRDFKNLMGYAQGAIPVQGRYGLFDFLDQALQANDLTSARAHLAEISRLFRGKQWDNLAVGQQIRTFLGQIKEEIKGIEGKERAHTYANRRYASELRKLQGRLAQHEKWTNKLNDTHQSFMEELTTHPAARFHPLLQAMLRQKLTTAAQQLYHGINLDSVIRSIDNSASWGSIKAAFGNDAMFDTMKRDVVTSWLDLTRQGYNPIWMHYVDPSRYSSILTPTILPDRYSSPGMWEDKVFNARPAMTDIAAGVSRGGVEIISSRATKEFVDRHLMPYVQSHGEVERHLTNQFIDAPPKAVERRLRNPQTSVAIEVRSYIQREYVPFDPSKYGLGGYVKAGEEEMLIPKGVDRALQLMTRDYKLRLGGAYDRVMGVYKFSVLTTPRHLAHIALGGMTMTMLREPGAITHIGQAINMVRRGEAPIELSASMYDLSNDQLFHFTAGKTMGRLLAEKFGDKAHGWAKFEEHVATTERVMSYLNAGGAANHEIALQHALKVFIDMDGMSPFERVVIRNVFPFYSFTKHIMRYLLTYPIDHPIRAAVLSHYAEQYLADWNSGLPQKFDQLFFLGHPDRNGNVTTVDFKSLNPFRSVANDFTLAGFIQSLNPLITGPMAAAGTNTLSATPDLYPQLTYDTVSGTETPKRSDVLMKFTQAFIPEISALDHFIGITGGMRRMKAKNPTAYRSQLFSVLGIPFAWAKQNIPYVQEKAELARYKAAQTAESTAERTGNFAEAARYNEVPSSSLGGVVPEPMAQQYYTELFKMLRAAGITNVAPKALTPARRPRKSGPLGSISVGG